MPEIFRAYCTSEDGAFMVVDSMSGRLLHVHTKRDAATDVMVVLDIDRARRLTAALIDAGFGPEVVKASAAVGDEDGTIWAALEQQDAFLCEDRTTLDNHEARLVRLESAEQAALAMFGRRINQLEVDVPYVDIEISSMARRVTAMETRLNSAAAELKG